MLKKRNTLLFKLAQRPFARVRRSIILLEGIWELIALKCIRVITLQNNLAGGRYKVRYNSLIDISNIINSPVISCHSFAYDLFNIFPKMLFLRAVSFLCASIQLPLLFLEYQTLLDPLP
jgi:hypothetical protein